MRSWKQDDLFFLCRGWFHTLGWDIVLGDAAWMLASQVLAQPCLRDRRSAFGPTFLESLENFDATSVPCQCLMWEAMISMVTLIFINFPYGPIQWYSQHWSTIFHFNMFFPCCGWLSNTLPSMAIVGLPLLSSLTLEPFLGRMRETSTRFYLHYKKTHDL